MEGGFHEGLALLRVLPPGSMMRRLHTRSAAASNIGEPIPPHSHRRTTKKIANTTNTATTTSTITSKGKGISQ